ncbi:MAG: hypothetical protein GWO38_29955 [Phycisphaerae bacterium]|nr:hypothetical protein [Phycisphaerae bacterium]NIX01924.1 hypothetical protein [Phycisphaerae bacterium]NIX31740.1 hypothetical protein [Phycisphaerae bacterium]
MNQKKDKKEKAAKPKVKKSGKYVGKDLKIKLPSGAEFEGLCIAERKIPKGGEQVFLKLTGPGVVSRYFNVEDIVD